MTKENAIQWMELGARLTHKFFSKDEWVSINDKGLYCFEDGVECDPEEFWKWRQEDTWNTGWDFSKLYDPYICIAAKQHRCSLEEVTSKMRAAWKHTLFGLSYGEDYYEID